MRTITMLLLVTACSSEPFGPELFGTGGAAGAAGEAGSSSAGAAGSAGSGGGSSGAAGSTAGAAGAAGAPNPCDACKCAEPNAACPIVPSNHCQGVVDQFGKPLPSCCECPAECSLAPEACSYFPGTAQWCCP